MFASLEDILNPITLTDFQSKYLGVEPLSISRNSERGVADLFSFSMLDELLSSGLLVYPGLQLAQNGNYISPGSFASDIEYGAGTMRGVLNNREVRGHFQAGATIILNAISRYVPTLRRICASVEATLGATVSANAYITPANSKGFAAHYDTHDVLVLQLSGSKKWNVHKPILENPLPDQFVDLPTDLGPPLLRPTLTPASLLYLPRGFVHSARAGSHASIHITFALNQYTWYDLLKEAVRRAKEDPQLRAAIPGSILANGLPQNLIEHLRKLSERFLSESALGEACSVLRHSSLIERPLSNPRVSISGVVCPSPDLSDLYLSRASEPFVRMYQSRRKCIVVVDDFEIVFSDRLEKTLTWALSQRSLRVGDLPDCTKDEAIEIARQLCEAGVFIASEK